VRRNLALLGGAAAGTVALVLLRRRASTGPAADPRAEELRRKLAQAREEAADAEDFEAAGMGAETLVEEEPRRTPAPQSGDVEEGRRRVHEEARAVADEMRRGGTGPEGGAHA
jgi:hypothetical protein